MTAQWSTRAPRVWSSNPRPAKSFTVLQMARHRFSIYAKYRGCLGLVNGTLKVSQYLVKFLFGINYGRYLGIQTFHHIAFIHPTVITDIQSLDFSSRGHISTGHAITQAFNHFKI